MIRYSRFGPGALELRPDSHVTMKLRPHFVLIKFHQQGSVQVLASLHGWKSTSPNWSCLLQNTLHKPGPIVQWSISPCQWRCLPENLKLWPAWLLNVIIFLLTHSLRIHYPCDLLFPGENVQFQTKGNSMGGSWQQSCWSCSSILRIWRWWCVSILRRRSTRLISSIIKISTLSLWATRILAVHIFLKAIIPRNASIHETPSCSRSNSYWRKRRRKGSTCCYRKGMSCCTRLPSFHSCSWTSWQLTLYRRGKQHRIEVQYSARRKSSHLHLYYPPCNNLT